ncbi:DUF3303 family protein [uncultured Desulfosarcina sp.]|uniref:DUF3303 domain-containing protein n=1 Tax=uncultured Desulfosarcina sp. TaxID=218289 RepID=UPI0029C6D8D9|nr:DUF3303 family protein [uncultured Desulfosarcina sp.]
MLFMSIFTYEPDKRDEVLKRRAEGLFTPEGAKCVGQWSSTAGGRAFTLFELDNALVAAQWSQVWNDLGKFEVYPVVDTDEMMKAMAAARG